MLYYKILLWYMRWPHCCCCCCRCYIFIVFCRFYCLFWTNCKMYASCQSRILQKLLDFLDHQSDLFNKLIILITKSHGRLPNKLTQFAQQLVQTQILTHCFILTGLYLFIVVLVGGCRLAIIAYVRVVRFVRLL